MGSRDFDGRADRCAGNSGRIVERAGAAARSASARSDAGTLPAGATRARPIAKPEAANCAATAAGGYFGAIQSGDGRLRGDGSGREDRFWAEEREFSNSR